MERKEMKRNGEEGNVLFLILIAVALFAALSYAVTQSTRSGSGDASSETNLISSSTLTQYPAGIRTSLVRMIISGGLDVDDFEFNPPSDFGSLSSNANGVFHPSGGGSTYQYAPADVMEDGAPGQWFFNGNFEVPELGTSSGGGNELIAFLPGVRQSICRRLNEEYGIVPAGTATNPGIPDFNATTDGDITDSMLDGENMPTTDREDISNGSPNDLAGEAFGCFFDSSFPANSQFIYYHVLMER